MLNKAILLRGLMIAALLLTGIFIISVRSTNADGHPAGITGMPLCSNCHDDSRAALDHSGNFIKRHRFYASQRGQECGVCHRESFCSDCHARKEEIKPGDKFKDSPERFSPHRGDYISRHKIDGRINPAPCLKCHGRKNNARCKRCHR